MYTLHQIPYRLRSTTLLKHWTPYIFLIIIIIDYETQDCYRVIFLGKLLAVDK